jgi:hypothetical protein
MHSINEKKLRGCIRGCELRRVTSLHLYLKVKAAYKPRAYDDTSKKKGCENELKRVIHLALAESLRCIP